MEPAFSLRLIDQHWLGPEGERLDLTSHGNIELVVNGEDISGCQHPDSNLGINQSAVALLQTVFADHTPQPPDKHITEPLFYHGCWIGGTCPNRVIDFRVRHSGANVLLDQFYVTGHAVDDPKKHYGDCVSLPNLEYARQLLEFGKQSYSFLPRNREGEDWEVDMYKSWRNELAALNKMAETYLRRGKATDAMHRRAAEFHP